MEHKECESGMRVYVLSADDSVNILGGGSVMKSMIGHTCEIVDVGNTKKSVCIRHEIHGQWWFVPSDLKPSDIEVEPNIFHFDEANL